MLQVVSRGNVVRRVLQSTSTLHYQQQSSSFASSSRLRQEEIASEDESARTTVTSSKPSKRKVAPASFSIDSFPSLMSEPDPILDRFETIVSPATPDKSHKASVTVYNEPKLFEPARPSAASLILSGGDTGDSDIDSAAYLSTITPFSAVEINNLHQYLLRVKRVTQMTGKGKVSRMAALVVAGNGRGLVGVGEGKDENAGNAAQKAFHEAVKNMDYVERHEGRTILAEATTKWSSTTVTLRPRPAGFGLRVPPVIHFIARACGISDLSASILGSANQTNVVKATLQLLWGGSAPLGLGDGIGGSMRRKDKGAGIRTIRDIELARGRRLREVRD